MKMSQSLVRWTAAVVHCAARCTILWYCSRWRCGLHPPPPTQMVVTAEPTEPTARQVTPYTTRRATGGAGRGYPGLHVGTTPQQGGVILHFFGQFLKPTIAIYLNFVVVVKFFLLLQRTLAKLKIRNTFFKIYF